MPDSVDGVVKRFLTEPKWHGDRPAVASLVAEVLRLRGRLEELGAWREAVALALNSEAPVRQSRCNHDWNWVNTTGFRGHRCRKCGEEQP